MRTFSRVLLFLFCFLVPAASQPIGQNIGGGIGTFDGGIGFGRVSAGTCTQATAYIAALDGSATVPFKTAATNLICAMVAHGTFGLVQGLYLQANTSAANTRVNVINPGAFNLTLHGTCTFTALTGITGDGTTCYLDPSFVPSVSGGAVMTQNSATYGVCILNPRTTPSGSLVAYGGQDATHATYFEALAGSGFATGGLNSGGGDSTLTTSTAGSWILTRTGASTTQYYFNGAAVSTTSPSTSNGLPASTTIEFAYNNNGTVIDFTTDQQAYWFFGAGLTSGQAQSLYADLGTFLTAVGVTGGCSNSFSSASLFFDSVGGSDLNNCTTTLTPCQTVAKMQGGLYAGGATINWKGGSSFTGCLALSATNVHSTTPSNPITIQQYSTGAAPIITGNCGTGYGNKNAVLTIDSINANVNGIRVVGPGFGNTSLISDYCIAAQNSSGLGTPVVIIENNTATGCAAEIWTSGFAEAAGFPSACGNISPSVLNNTVSGAIQLSLDGSGQSGSGCGGTGNDTLTSQGNLYFDIGGDTTQAGAAQGNGAGYNGPTVGSVMQFELAHDNGGNFNVCGGPAGLWQASTNGTIQRFSEAYNEGNFTTGTASMCDGDGFDLDVSTSNDVVEYVYSHHNFGPGFLMFVSYTGNTFRYSISENDQWSLLNVNNSANNGGGILSFNQSYSSFFVYNMTVFSSGSGAFTQNGPACWNVGGTWPTSGVIVANNACWNSSANSLGSTVMINGNHVTASGGATPVNNDYYYPGVGTLVFAYEWNSVIYNTLAAFQSGESLETNSIAVNPSTGTWTASGTCAWTPSTISSWPPSGCPSTYSAISGAVKSAGATISSPGVIDYYGATIPGAGSCYNIGASGACPFSFNTQVFNCTAFALSGTCGVSLIGGGGQPFAIVGSQNGTVPGIVGSAVELVTNGAVHVGLAVNYQTKANIQAFQAHYTFVPDGWNIALAINNSDALGSGQTGAVFAAGAGCEAGFFQGFPYANTGSNNTGNLFALEIDQFSGLTAGVNTFTHSSAQWYAPGLATPPNAPNPPGVSPCNGNLGGSGFTYVGVNKIATTPVELSTIGTPNSTISDIIDVTVTYTSNNQTLVMDMFDSTAGGTCTPVTSATCFHNVWTSVNIPTIVGANTAWVGLTAGTNTASPAPLLINTFSFFNP